MQSMYFISFYRSAHGTPSFTMCAKSYKANHEHMCLCVCVCIKSNPSSLKNPPFFVHLNDGNDGGGSNRNNLPSSEFCT